ncbi:MAG: alpha-amylase/4-alpha-glucanotransferase domain-containing protein, partial [Candidatus Zixiibacteriota bacterium]
MEKFKLAIGIHNHQPVGNFDSVIDEAHNKSYMPFLQLFEQFDKLKLSLHQSGILWKWQEKRYPEYFDIVQRLLYDDRLEILTGGFFEPILPSIPDRDKLGQIEMLSRYIEGQFGYDATGLWVTERVWEPHLPSILNQAGVQYVPIDDTHFLYAGFELNQLRGRFITENEGAMISLLPIQKRLRYSIPFGTVEEVIEELRAQADINPGGLAVYADDGEKFGVWPKTYEHCYVDGWLKDFFTALSENSDWLEVTTLGKAAQTKPIGRAYLPTASYAEMLQGALPPMAYAEYEEFEEFLKKREKLEKYGRFVRGGHWRGFLTKYDESNMMHKRMMLASDRL